MLQDKEIQQAEEVSRGIDMLNEGRKVDTGQREVAKMLEMAGLVKQSYNKEHIPRDLIAGMADTLAAELGAGRKKRRRRWLYGGLAGTAAALFIAVSAHMFLSELSGQQFAQQHDTERQEQQMTVNSAQAGGVGPAAQPEVHGNPAPENDKPAVAEGWKNLVPGVVGDIPGKHDVQAPDKEAESNQMAILQEGASGDIHRSNALLAKSRKRSGAEEKISRDGPMDVMLVLPNQTAQSVTVDHENNIIRQVYILDNGDEITVTQTLAAVSGDDTKASVLPPPADSHTGQSSGGGNLKNSVKVSQGAYDITIEGAKTDEELRLLAASLVAEKIEE